MAIGDITLSASAQANLSALQNTTNLLSKTQAHLSTGKTVNSASDNATAYFASQGFLNSANNLNGIKASLTTALQAVSSFDNSISDVTSVIVQLQGVATQALGTTSTVTRQNLASQFNALTTQLDQLVNDATFNGTNLLNNSTSNTLVVYFNQNNTTALTITGVDLTSATLLTSSGKTAGNNWAAATDIQGSQSYLTSALATLTSDAATFGGNSTLLQTRQDFTSNLINSLTNASNALIQADTNTEGANLQALQAQDQLGIVALGVSSTLAQAILRIL